MPIPTPKMPTRTMAPANPAQGKIKISFGGIGSLQRGQLVILAGKGGTGKTTAAAMKPGETAFIDLEKLPADSAGEACSVRARPPEAPPHRAVRVH